MFAHKLRTLSLKYKVKYETCEIRKTMEFTLVNNRFHDELNEVSAFIL